MRQVGSRNRSCFRLVPPLLWTHGDAARQRAGRRIYCCGGVLYVKVYSTETVLPLY